MLKKLRIKFVCIMMAIVTVMMCVIMGFVIGFTQRDLERESQDALRKASADPGFLVETREEGSSLPYFIMQTDFRGNLTVRGTINMDQFGTEQLQLFWNIANRSEYGEIEEYDLIFQSSAGFRGKRYVFVDISSQKMAIRSLVRACAAVGVVSLLALWGISMLLARWAVRPVEKAWEQQRQFVADASHELKTPLTVIMTNAELLQNPGYDEQSRLQFSASILTMSQQMRGLVQGLLELARVDNGAAKTNFVQLDFGEVVTDSVLPFEPLYFEKGLFLSTQIEDGIAMKGNESYLRQVIDILLDNAMKYSFPGGTVQVILKRQGSNGVLSVASPGEQISSEDLKNIFKRFYRIDKVRSRDGSYGLGLSIAQSIVSEHRGRIWAESESGINTFFVQLPLV